MGIVIEFPTRQRISDTTSPAVGTGEVVILPVIRIDRSPDAPTDGLESNAPASGTRKRRRRASRS